MAVCLGRRRLFFLFSTCHLLRGGTRVDTQDIFGAPGNDDLVVLQLRVLCPPLSTEYETVEFAASRGLVHFSLEFARNFVLPSRMRRRYVGILFAHFLGSLDDALRMVHSVERTPFLSLVVVVVKNIRHAHSFETH